MLVSTQTKLLLGLFLCCLSSSLLASEADELQERAKGLQKEAAQAAERGEKQQAAELENGVRKLLKKAEELEQKQKRGEEPKDRPERKEELRQLHDRLQDLRAKEQKLKEEKAPENERNQVAEQRLNLERELRKISGDSAGKPGPNPEIRERAQKLEAIQRRVQHLKVAAQNLKAAEAHDLAHQVMEKAEAMEREAQEGKSRLMAEMQKGNSGKPGPDGSQHLKAEIERLRAEVQELRQHMQKR